MALADLLDPRLLRPRTVVPAVLALVIGVTAWFGLRPALFGDGAEPAPPPAPPQAVAEEAPEPEPEVVYPFVLTAKRPIQSGVLLTVELVEWVEWREALDVNVAVMQDAVPLQAILGAVTLRSFAEGELMAWDGLIVPGSPGFVTAVLAPGHRAVTVEVDRATTLANLIYPGDHVDVILVADTAAGEVSADAVPRAQSIVHGVRVLAVGSTTISLGRYGRRSVQAAGMIEGVAPPEGETYTLELVPKDAERIALATQTGRLTLAIRPIFTGPHAAATDGLPVQFGDVMGSAEEEPDEPLRVRVIRGGTDDELVTL